MKLFLQLVIKLALENLPVLEWQSVLFLPENAAAPWSLKTAAPLDFSTSDLPTMHYAWVKSKQRSSVHIPAAHLTCTEENKYLKLSFKDLNLLKESDICSFRLYTADWYPHSGSGQSWIQFLVNVPPWFHVSFDEKTQPLNTFTHRYCYAVLNPKDYVKQWISFRFHTSYLNVLVKCLRSITVFSGLRGDN